MPPLFLARLSWPPATAGTRYRVVIRNLARDGLLKIESDEASVFVTGPPATFGWPEWRIQTANDDGSWSDYLPYLDWPGTVAASRTLLAWPDDGSIVHRIVVRDEARDEVVLKAATLESSYAVDWSRLHASHAHRWRLQRWDAGEWADMSPYVPLEPDDLTVPPFVAERGEAAGAVSRANVLFLFTSDTEVHLRWMAEPDHTRGIEQQIFGRVDGREIGVGLQMDILDAHGFKGTFFVDVLAEFQFGDGSLQPVFDAILERGHDVQLHLHPNPHLRFAREEGVRKLSTATSVDDPAAFRAAMELALDLYERRTGCLPVAYRAGAYRIFDSHFPILRELGIVVDSSVNPFKNCRVSPWLWTRTQPFWVEGVLEVPITWHLRQHRGETRPEQLRPVTSPEMQQKALAATPAAPALRPPTTICYIAHSFSFLETTRTLDAEKAAAWNANWERLVGQQESAISGYRVGAPVIEVDHVDDRRIDTFRSTLAELARRPRLAGISLRELAAHRLEWRGDDQPTTEPLPLYDYDVGRSRLTVARRYSAPFLAHLEAAGP